MTLLFWLACSTTPNTTAPSTGPPPPGTVITTTETLAQRVPLPEAVESVRYRLDMLGSPGLGPTDYRLAAWVSLSSDAEVESLYGPSLKVSQSPEISSTEADLLPPDLRPVPKHGVMRLNGALRPGGSGGSMVVDQVVQVHGRGVFIWAHTQ
ncbi:MAG: hypothetical protein ACI9VR_000005 [Cognaticolwellia sp.]